MTITQVSAVCELHASDPRVGARGLYSAGIRIGRDHIASTVNTLVLVYTAAALPTLPLFSQSGLAIGEVLTTKTLAVAIVPRRIHGPRHLGAAHHPVGQLGRHPRRP